MVVNIISISWLRNPCRLNRHSVRGGSRVRNPCRFSRHSVRGGSRVRSPCRFSRHSVRGGSREHPRRSHSTASIRVCCCGWLVFIPTLLTAQAINEYCVRTEHKDPAWVCIYVYKMQTPVRDLIFHPTALQTTSPPSVDHTTTPIKDHFR